MTSCPNCIGHVHSWDLNCYRHATTGWDAEVELTCVLPAGAVIFCPVHEDMDRTIQALRAELAMAKATKREKEGCREILATAGFVLSDLPKMCFDVASAYLAGEREKLDLKSRLSECETVLNDAEMEADMQKSRADELYDKFLSAEGKFIQENQRLLDAEKVLATLKIDVQGYEVENQRLREENGRFLQRDLERSVAEDGRLKDQNLALMTECGTHLSRIRTLKTELDTAQSKLVELSNQIAKLIQTHKSELIDADAWHAIEVQRQAKIIRKLTKERDQLLMTRRGAVRKMKSPVRVKKNAR